MSAETQKRILVVDDEETVVSFLTATLQRGKYEVLSTTKGKEAVHLARQHLPDAIILDMRIPDLSGEEIFKILSGDPLTRNIPIIYFTALVTEDEEELVRGITGRMRVLSKPTTPEKVLEAVKRTLSGE